MRAARCPGRSIIDCCPLLNVLSLNAVFAADIVLVPVSADFLSLQGAEQVERALNALEPVFKRRLPRRYVLTRYDARRRMSAAVVARMAQSLRADEVCVDAHPGERETGGEPGGGTGHLPPCAGQPRRARLRDAVRRASGCRPYGMTAGWR